MDELKGLVCHTANLKMEVVKGIIQGSEFKPKLAKHAPCMARHCFKSLFSERIHEGVYQHKQLATVQKKYQDKLRYLHLLWQSCAPRAVPQSVVHVSNTHSVTDTVVMSISLLSYQQENWLAYFTLFHLKSELHSLHAILDTSY